MAHGPQFANSYFRRSSITRSCLPLSSFHTTLPVAGQGRPQCSFLFSKPSKLFLRLIDFSHPLSHSKKCHILIILPYRALLFSFMSRNIICYCHVTRYIVIYLYIYIVATILEVGKLRLKEMKYIYSGNVY